MKEIGFGAKEDKDDIEDLFERVDELESLVRDFRALSDTYTTALRPNAKAVGIGKMIFNETTGLPNWSDGSQWVDATGSTV